MNSRQRAAAAATMVALMGGAGPAQAVFQGRDATGAASSTCTSSGAGKCTYFYDTTLDITILNNWNIGQGTWSASAAPGSAQALAASAGLTASGLSGWVLPTGDPFTATVAQNQFRSILDSAGGSLAGLSSQFDGVQLGFYWSGSAFVTLPTTFAWAFRVDGLQEFPPQGFSLLTVAVRPGDVAAVPQPPAVAMLLLGLVALVPTLRKRR